MSEPREQKMGGFAAFIARQQSRHGFLAAMRA
jgi:hypothetical protein